LAASSTAKIGRLRRGSKIDWLTRSREEGYGTIVRKLEPMKREPKEKAGNSVSLAEILQNFKSNLPIS